MVRCQLGWKPPLPNLLDPPFAQGKGREGKRPTDADVVVILSSSLLLSIRNSHPGTSSNRRPAFITAAGGQAPLSP